MMIAWKTPKPVFNWAISNSFIQLRMKKLPALDTIDIYVNAHSNGSNVLELSCLLLLHLQSRIRKGWMSLFSSSAAFFRFKFQGRFWTKSKAFFLERMEIWPHSWLLLKSFKHFSNLWWMPNLFCKGFGQAIEMGSWLETHAHVMGCHWNWLSCQGQNICSLTKFSIQHKLESSVQGCSQHTVSELLRHEQSGLDKMFVDTWNFTASVRLTNVTIPPPIYFENQNLVT